MSAQEHRLPTRLTLTIGTTQRVGEFDFDKVTVSLERDLAILENPLDGYRDINALLRKVLQEITPPSRKLSGPEKSLASSAAAPNGLALKDTSPSSTPLEKILDSLPWAPGKTPGREWIRIKDHPEATKTLAAIDQKSYVNAYCTIGRHVYRIEGDFLGRYPKREGGKT
jgi:hypothetical protein